MIRHLLLLHPSGAPLFTSSFEAGIDCCSEEHVNHNALVAKSSLFSSFLTGINTLANEFGGNLKHMKLAQWDVFMETKDELTGVKLTNPSDDHKDHDEYSQTLSDINSKFLEIYHSDLKKWTGEVTRFQSFRNIINDQGMIKKDASLVNLCSSCIESINNSI